MAWYQPVPVTADVRGELVCGWTARIEGRHLLVPDGCVDILWLADGRLGVCGPETTAWSFVLPPRTEAAGLRFRPGVAPGLLGVPAHALVNRRVDLADLVGAGRARQLAERVADAATPGARPAILEVAARRWLINRDGVDPLAARVTAELAQRPWSVTSLADALGLTDRQLQRRSRAVFGYPPSTLRGLMRLQRFMTLARTRPGTRFGLATLAYSSGYTDQAHLSHETRKIAGMTPRELLASEAPYWHGDETVWARQADRELAVTG